jgi:nicotinamide riboside kinase
MLRQQALKIAFIGSHGVGKTTLCYGLAARLKQLDISLEVVNEVARRCPLPINRDTTVAAQSWILHCQIAEEIVAAARYDLVICDRSTLDNYVYLLLASQSHHDLEAMVTSWTATYDLLVKVPIIQDPKADGLRSTDPLFQRAVEHRLQQEIDRRHLSILDLNAYPRHDWLEHVEAAVHQRFHPPTQLELL